MFRSEFGMKITASILLIFLFASCAHKVDMNNEIFLKDYGKEVIRINKKREALTKEQNSAYYVEAKDNLIDTSRVSGPSDHHLSDDMFIIRYNMINYPDSYMKAPLSFDDIRIPAKDAYGIDSGLGDKNYILLDHQVLQRNVDYINTNNTMDDREIRNTLVKEQKELDRKIKSGAKNDEEDKPDHENDDQQNLESESELEK